MLYCLCLSYVTSNWLGSYEPPFRHYLGHPNGAELVVKPTTTLMQSRVGFSRIGVCPERVSASYKRLNQRRTEAISTV